MVSVEIISEEDDLISVLFKDADRTLECSKTESDGTYPEDGCRRREIPDGDV